LGCIDGGDAGLEELRALDVALRGTMLERTIDRGLLLVADARARLDVLRETPAVHGGARVRPCVSCHALLVYEHVSALCLKPPARNSGTLAWCLISILRLMEELCIDVVPLIFAQDKDVPAAKADDVVRLFDTLIVHMGELGDLSLELSGLLGELLMDETAAKVHLCMLLDFGVEFSLVFSQSNCIC
jgi:hypothetical protein